MSSHSRSISQCVQGASGIQGPQGESGPSGFPGFTGLKGQPGTKGIGVGRLSALSLYLQLYRLLLYHWKTDGFCVSSFRGRMEKLALRENWAEMG